MQNEFKVGDWVRYKNKLHQVSYVRDNTNENSVDYTFHLDKEFVYKLGNIYWISEYELEPWQPKEGELCWFKSASNTAEFGVYVGKTNGVYQMRPINSGCIFNYSYCEPFIGQPPSFYQKETK